MDDPLPQPSKILRKRPSPKDPRLPQACSRAWLRPTIGRPATTTETPKVPAASIMTFQHKLEETSVWFSDEALIDLLERHQGNMLDVFAQWAATD